MNKDEATDIKVSIITPSYNTGKFINDTIISIINQTYINIEHIIVDGGSTDSTINVLKQYENHIKWISEPDNGMYDAINKGIDLATGDIYTYINADDYYFSKDVIELVAKIFKQNKHVDFVFGHCCFVDVYGVKQYVYRAPIFIKKLSLAYPRNLFHQPTCFWRKSAHIPFDSSFRYCGDSLFFRHLCKNHFGINSHKIIANFRLRQDNLATVNREAMAYEDKRVFGDASVRKRSLLFRLIDLFYIRFFLNLLANIKRYSLYRRNKPFL